MPKFTHTHTHTWAVGLQHATILHDCCVTMWGAYDDGVIDLGDARKAAAGLGGRNFAFWLRSAPVLQGLPSSKGFIISTVFWLHWHDMWHVTGDLIYLSYMSSSCVNVSCVMWLWPCVAVFASRVKLIFKPWAEQLLLLAINNYKGGTWRNNITNNKKHQQECKQSDKWQVQA